MLLASLVTACAGSMTNLRQTPQPPSPTSAPPASPTLEPIPTATPRLEVPTATSLPPTPIPTPTPVPATAVPAPVIPMRISAQLDPPTPRAGIEFTLRLTVNNDDPSRTAQGIYVATSGPWERWTVMEITPSGTFARDASGWRLISAVQIPARDSRNVDLRIRADEPAEEQLTFAVREAEAGELQQIPGGQTPHNPSAREVPV